MRERIDYQLLTEVDKYKEVIRSNPLWYIDPEIGQLITEYFLEKQTMEKDELWNRKRKEIVQMFVDLLDTDEVALGNQDEGFNDDDRWIPKYFGRNPKVEKNHPDTIVIHHTSTPPNTPYQVINALGILRLYVPVYKSKAFMVGAKYQPISSGHIFKGKQTFVGYHHLVHQDGSIDHLLKDEYTGFHAGDYTVNCRSIGIAFCDDLSELKPTSEALANVRMLIEKYNPDYILGHKEVVKADGGQVETDCPGKLFLGENGWKNYLQLH